jgi:hypothetical protein
MEAVGELFADETSLAVSNTKEYVYYRPSRRVDLKIRKGDPIKEGTITQKALANKRKIAEFIDRDLFGVPYYGVAVPIVREGQITGCVTAIFPTLSSSKSVVTVKHEDGWVPIPFPQIMYVEARERKTHVVTKELTGTHRYTLNEFEFLLPKDDFIRCHRSFIVNVHYIQEIYADSHSALTLVMKNGTRIPVSQIYAPYFRKLLSF